MNRDVVDDQNQFPKSEADNSLGYFPREVPASLSRMWPHAAKDWKSSLRDAVRDAYTLRSAVGLPLAEHTQERDEDFGFPVFVPWEYINRMEYGNPQDPLLLQVLPVAEEGKPVGGFSFDAVGDGAAALGHGLLRKYARRSLLVVNGTCAVHCRYCFRRHFAYQETGPAEWMAALARIREDPSTEEIILSGGDPWTLTDDRLASFVADLDRIPHLRRIRFHTRLPILIPRRVTPELIEILRNSRCQTSVVVHANHAQELCSDTQIALKTMVRNGIPVLNQTVLLRGINDSVESLFALCRELINLGVLPYYLHQLDRVAGAAHFEVPIEVGRQLIHALREMLPGYGVPRYVQEVAGEKSKRVLL
jgi:EF-P beta-lysylation protein EpmB